MLLSILLILLLMWKGVRPMESVRADEYEDGHDSGDYSSDDGPSAEDTMEA